MITSKVIVALMGVAVMVLGTNVAPAEAEITTVDAIVTVSGAGGILA